MVQKPKVAFVCVHNFCRSQIAEALGKLLAADVFDSYSAGTETKPQINQDAVRLMKRLYGVDMELTQHSKLLANIPRWIFWRPWAVTYRVRPCPVSTGRTGDWMIPPARAIMNFCWSFNVLNREFLPFTFCVVCRELRQFDGSQVETEN